MRRHDSKSESTSLVNQQLNLRSPRSHPGLLPDDSVHTNFARLKNHRRVQTKNKNTLVALMTQIFASHERVVGSDCHAVKKRGVHAGAGGILPKSEKKSIHFHVFFFFFKKKTVFHLVPSMFSFILVSSCSIHVHSFQICFHAFRSVRNVMTNDTVFGVSELEPKRMRWKDHQVRDSL